VDNNELDLEYIVDLELQDQPNDPEPFLQDQYGLDIECQTYRDHHLEIEQAIGESQKLPKMDNPDHPSIIEIEDDVKIIEYHPTEPKIIRRINPFKEGW